MNKKDYKIITAVIANCPFTSIYDKTRIVSRLSYALSKDNKNFDKAKFTAACFPKI